MNDLQRRMIGHGAILLSIGLIAGFGLLMSLIGGFEVWPGALLEFDVPGDSAGWGRTHGGGIMNGLMIMIIALVMWAMAIEGKLEQRLYWMFVGAGYANTLFYWAGMIAANRALTLGDNVYGETSIMGVVGLVPAFVFAFVTLVAAVLLARHAFSVNTATASIEK